MAMTQEVRNAVEMLSVIQGIQVLVCPPESVQPVFIRFPRYKQRCAVTDLSAGTLRRLIEGSEGKVKVLTVRAKGKLRGARLIDRDSLIAYVHSLPLADFSKPEEAEEGAADAS